MNNPAEKVADEVWRVDVCYPVPDNTCCYLILRERRAAIVDCGGKRGADAVLSTLRQLQMAPEAVEWLLVTHAHLDHAAAAGRLMQLLPNVVLAAHPSTAKHLQDPHEKLQPATRALYGDAFYDEHYGELLAIDSARIKTLADEETVVLGGRRLRAVHTPGHAWHHLSVYDERAKIVYAGDAYGVCYPEFRRPRGQSLIVPVTPPTQFAPTETEESIRRLRALRADTIAFAHFGVIDDGEAAAQSQLAFLREWMDAALETAKTAGDDFTAVFRRRLQESIRQKAVADGLSAERAAAAAARYLEACNLSVDGFRHYLQKQNLLPN